jgi:hypothetical protein
VSAVLRKKIESGAGIPPSVLQLQQFWLQLQTRTCDWARETYGTGATISLGTRRVVNGQDVQRALDTEIAFYFSAEASPGLCAMAIDNAGAIRNAAARMNQDVDSITDASPLFLKLLAEQAAIVLWGNVAGGLLDTRTSKSSPFADPKAAAGKFETSSRYLLVEYQLQLGEQASRVWFAFSFDFMQKFARESLRQIADQKVQARHQSQKTLSDSVRASTITLDAVLDRMSLTIGECSKLEVGTILPLSGADAGRLSLSADTINGSVDIGSGELGVWKRQRALKLRTPILESFAQEIADL